MQVSRSDWDIVLDLAQVFATFKMGGQEFKRMRSKWKREQSNLALRKIRVSRVWAHSLTSSFSVANTESAIRPRYSSAGQEKSQ